MREVEGGEEGEPGEVGGGGEEGKPGEGGVWPVRAIRGAGTPVGSNTQLISSTTYITCLYLPPAGVKAVHAS